MSFIMSVRIRRSFSPVAQSIFDARAGPTCPSSSRRCVTLFAWFGSISPNAVAPIGHGPGVAISSLNAPPTPSSATARCHPSRLALP